MMVAAMVVSAASSCQKNTPYFPNVINEEIFYDVSSKIDMPVAFVGAADADFLGQAIRSRVVRTTSVDEARVIFIKSSDLMANAQIIRDAWLAGKTIVELWPSVATHSAFWSSIDAPVYLRGDESTNDLILLSECRYSCYQLQNPFLEDAYSTGGIEIPGDAPVVEDMSDAPTPVNYTAVEIGKTIEFINTKLNSLVEWANGGYGGIADGDNSPNASLPTPTFDGDLSKRIEDANAAQIIRKTFNIGVDKFKIDQYPLSDPDEVSRHSTIDLTMHIVPLYSYEKNVSGKSGDYYFVDMNLISHNEALCKDYFRRHGLLPVFAHIFFGRKMDWKATLKRIDGSSYRVLEGGELNFFDTPVPPTTENSSSYTSGFTGTLSVDGQLGYMGGLNGSLTVGGAFSWNNTRTETVADQSIEMSTDPSTRGVHYCYFCNNDQMTEDLKDAVKAIARTDQKCNASWCWHVNSTKDNDHYTQFAIEFELNPVYRWQQRRCSWAAKSCWRYDKDDLLSKNNRKFYIDIHAPNRLRNGIIELKSTTSEYVTKLTIKDKVSGQIVVSDNSAYEKNIVQRYQVPTGTYDIEYVIRDGEGERIKGRYLISDVTVETAQTTSKASFEGKKIGDQ